MHSVHAGVYPPHEKAGQTWRNLSLNFKQATYKGTSGMQGHVGFSICAARAAMTPCEVEGALMWVGFWWRPLSELILSCCLRGSIIVTGQLFIHLHA